MANEDIGGIMIGAGCLNRCHFCEIPHDYRPLKSAIKEEEIRILKDLILYKKKGYTKIAISGSDPIEYEKLIHLVKYIKKLGFKDILLNTHGRKLSDKNFAIELINAGVNQLRMPLYGSNKDIHDSITMSKGSFKETIDGLNNLTDLDVKLHLNTLVMQQNKSDLYKILNLALKFKPIEFGISVMYVKSKANYVHYVPIKELNKYVNSILDYVVKKNLNVVFFDIPYCVFETFDNRIIMPRPHDLGKHNQPGNNFKSKIKNLATYRLKTKINICKACKVSENCDGFLVNDIKKFGTGNLKPIT